MHCNDADDNKYTHKHTVLLALHTPRLLLPHLFRLQLTRHTCYCAHFWWPLTYHRHIPLAFTVALLTSSALIKMYLVTLRLRQDEINLPYNITFFLLPSYFSLLESLLGISCFYVAFFFLIIFQKFNADSHGNMYSLWSEDMYSFQRIYLFL